MAEPSQGWRLHGGTGKDKAGDATLKGNRMSHRYGLRRIP